MKDIAWTVQRSIVMEIGAAISYLSQRHLRLDVLESFKSIYESAPVEWFTELGELNSCGAKIDSVLEILGTVSDCLFEEDYSQVSLKMRQISQTRVKESLVGQAIKLNYYPDHVGEEIEDLVNLAVKLHHLMYAQTGLLTSGSLDIQYKKDVEFAMSILAGRENHEQFWHWMDRFTYQAYLPWRVSRLPILATRQTQAEIALGTPSSEKRFPSLEWLDAKNVLNRIPELKLAVYEKELKIILWAEPFGLADNWLLTPGAVVVSFAQPGEIFEHFAVYNQQLAERIRALSDPTRLIILRIIRHFGMTNTDMAEFLGISRPTVSIHAKILREAGLIDSSQDGRITRHVIKPDVLRQLLKELEEFIDLPIE
jgi:DNA-binding transcriptional ArsR family regulator